MKQAINTQAQNEVKDLLNEYVVSPLNTDISNKLSKICREIEALNESAQVIDKISPSVNGNISSLQQKLDNIFHFDNEEDVFEDLSKEIEDIQSAVIGRIDKNREDLTDILAEIKNHLSELKTDSQKVVKQTNDAVKKKNNKELTESIYKLFEPIEELIKSLQSVSDISAKEIKSELSALQTSFSDTLSDFSAQINESCEQSKNHLADNQGLISKLQEIETLTTKHNEALTENINTELQAFSDKYTKQSAMIFSCLEETKNAVDSMESQQQTFIKHNYKTFFAVNLSFGIVNVVGFIIMIVLFLMR